MKCVAGLYFRLSKEEKTAKDESNSITNQRMILTSFCEKNGIEIYDEYIDDGHTGVNFDRAGFQRLIRDVKSKKINTLIVKDNSRFCRNHRGFMDYLEEIFPENNIRYIAVNSNVDTLLNPDNEIMYVESLMNEWYSKDLSKKVRATINLTREKGIFRQGNIPVYGYINIDKRTRKIDEPAAKVVRLIFDLYIKEKSSIFVMHYLNEHKIPTPAQYIKSVLGKKTNKNFGDENAKWSNGILRRIIRNVEYTGALVVNKSQNKSFKNRKKQTIRSSEWKYFEDKFEPIIDKETFAIAQSIMDNSVHEKQLFTKARTEPLAYLCYCGHCGLRLQNSSKQLKNGDISRHFYCKNKTCEGHFSVNFKRVEKNVMIQLELLKAYVLSHKQKLKENYSKKKVEEKDFSGEIKRLEEKKETEIKLIEKIIEQFVAGIITEEVEKSLLDKHNKLIKLIDLDINKYQNRKIIEYDKITIEDFIVLMENYEFEKDFNQEFLSKIIKKIIIQRNEEKLLTLTIEYQVINKDLESVFYESRIIS